MKKEEIIKKCIKLIREGKVVFPREKIVIQPRGHMADAMAYFIASHYKKDQP